MLGAVDESVTEKNGTTQNPWPQGHGVRKSIHISHTQMFMEGEPQNLKSVKIWKVRCPPPGKTTEIFSPSRLFQLSINCVVSEYFCQARKQEAHRGIDLQTIRYTCQRRAGWGLR